MSWRDKYAVHPAADVFPMMSDEALADLGEDIKKNGLKTPIIFQDTGGKELVLLDGRNRLEAMERAGILGGYIDRLYLTGDPVAHIIGLNIRRRHLTKEQQADLIVAATRAALAAETAKLNARRADKYIGRNGESVTERIVADRATILSVGESVKPRQEGEVCRGGRGKINPLKKMAVALSEGHDIGKRTIERSLAKAEGRIPEPSRFAGPKLRSRPKKLEAHTGLDAARRYYLERCADPGVDIDEEMAIVLDALREIAGRRFVASRGGPN